MITTGTRLLTDAVGNVYAIRDVWNKGRFQHCEYYYRGRWIICREGVNFMEIKPTWPAKKHAHIH